jgi:fatty-acyl-CoA synthase
VQADTQTIPHMLDDAAGRARAPALLFGDRAVGFDGLAERSASLAAGFASLGIGRGDVVLVWMVNRVEWLETFFALGRLGAIAFAANTRFRAAEIADILERARPRAVVSEASFRSIRFDALLDEALSVAGSPPLLRIAVSSDTAEADPPPGAYSYEALARETPAGASGVEAGDGAILFTTSGTTSRPKFVLHTHGSIAFHARAVASGFGMDAPGAAMLQALPYSGVFGFCQAMGAVAAARPSAVLPVFEAAAATAAVRQNRVTHFNATDEMIAAMVEADPDPASYASLRLVGAASFNRGSETLAGMARDVGLPIVGLYGMSELQALFARRSLDDPPSVRFRAGGRPVSDAYRVRIGQAAGGAPAAPEGELECAGPCRFSGYFGDPDATAAALADGGYMRTGDLGRLEPEYGFAFDGRLGDTLRLGGYLVAPAEIAAFIRAVPGVRDCQVVGVEVAGKQRAAAFVIGETPGAVRMEAIADACRDGLAPFKVPALVHELDAFPAVDSPNGVKVQRGQLRQLAEELAVDLR